MTQQVKVLDSPLEISVFTRTQKELFMRGYRWFVVFAFVLTCAAQAADTITFGVGTYTSDPLTERQLYEASPMARGAAVLQQNNFFGKISVQLNADGTETLWAIGFKGAGCKEGTELFGFRQEFTIAMDPLANGDDETTRKIKVTTTGLFTAVYEKNILAQMNFDNYMGHQWERGTYYDISDVVKPNDIPAVYDLMQVKDKVLYFGENTLFLDGTTPGTRPTTLHRGLALKLVEPAVEANTASTTTKTTKAAEELPAPAKQELPKPRF